MGYQQGWTPLPTEPPETESIRSMLHVTQILAIVFGILQLLGGIAYIGVVLAAVSFCNGIAGISCSGFYAGAIAWGIVIAIFGIVDFVIYLQAKEIEALVGRRQYEEAKGKTLVWTVIGFVLSGIILGVLLLVAYLKFDPVIAWQRAAGAGALPAGYGAPPAAAYGAVGTPPPAPIAPPPGPTAERYCPSCGAGNARAAGFCNKCGKPLPPVS